MKNGKRYKILLSKVAIKDKLNLKNSGLDKNCKKILDKMAEDPFCYPPSYDKLAGNLKGYYSRRINRQHRIIYRINEELREVYIVRMWTRYE